jgi:hypothetical protein
MAEHLFWRGQFDAAAQFIYPRLFDSEHVYMWWKFDFRLIYVRTMIEKKQFDDAQRELDKITLSLRKAFESGRLDHDDVREFGDNVTVLVELIKSRRAK